MELPFASFEAMDACSTIRVGMVEGKTAKKIYADTLRLYGNHMTIQQVRNWQHDFLAGIMSSVDKPHTCYFRSLVEPVWNHGGTALSYFELGSTLTVIQLNSQLISVGITGPNSSI